MTSTKIERMKVDKKKVQPSVPSICILSILFGFVHNHHGPKFPSVLVLQRKPTVLVFPIDDGVWKTAEKTPHRWRHAVKSAMYTTFIKIAPSNHQTTNREKKSSQQKVEAAHSTQNGQHKLEIRKFDGEKWNGIKICVTCGCQLSIIWNVRVDWSLCLVCMFVFVHAYYVTFSTAVQPENKYIFVMMAMRKGKKKKLRKLGNELRKGTVNRKSVLAKYRCKLKSNMLGIYALFSVHCTVHRQNVKR